MAQIDFSPIGDLAEIWKRGQRQAARDQALAQFAQGGQQFDPATRQLIAADPQLGMSLAQIAAANQRDQRDYGLRREQFDFTKKQAEATLEGARVPADFQALPGGGLQPKPGGPADPEYIRRKTEATDKGKQFNAGEITKLVEEGGKFSNLTGFSTTFQDRFAGYKIPMAGNAAMAVGRYAPALASQDVADGAQWWQGYDRYKNVVRNELFGSALTANEQAAFERADISPGMDPKTIRANLDAQQVILKDAMKRKAGALVAGGYQPEPIAKAYGLKLEDLGVEPKKPAAAAPGQSSWKNKETITAARANPQATLAEAKAAIAAGAPREAVIQRLQQVGIPATGL